MGQRWTNWESRNEALCSYTFIVEKTLLEYVYGDKNITIIKDLSEEVFYILPDHLIKTTCNSRHGYGCYLIVHHIIS